MTKEWEMRQPDSALSKCDGDEPVFVVCARDVLAPHTVLDWADRAERLGVSAEKVERARAVARDMVNWQRLRPQNLRLPG